MTMYLDTGGLRLHCNNGDSEAGMEFDGRNAGTAVHRVCKHVQNTEAPPAEARLALIIAAFGAVGFVYSLCNVFWSAAM